MTFINIVKSVGHFLVGAEPIAATLLKMFPPTSGIATALDGLFHSFQSSVVSAEIVSPQGGGPLKSQMVISDFESALSLTQSVLALEGKQMVWDDAKLKTVINTQVAALNAFSDFKSSFKIVAADSVTGTSAHS